MTIKRYGTSCTEHPEGIYVLHKDYLALEAEVRALREDVHRYDWIRHRTVGIVEREDVIRITIVRDPDPSNGMLDEIIDAARGAK